MKRPKGKFLGKVSTNLYHICCDTFNPECEEENPCDGKSVFGGRLLGNNKEAFLTEILYKEYLSKENLRYDPPAIRNQKKVRTHIKGRVKGIYGN